MSEILLLNGSSNSDGNTYDMIKHLEEIMACSSESFCETVQVNNILEELDTPYCTVCSASCEGKCYRDTSLDDLFTRMKSADAIVAGSPVYFGTVSAPLKSLWDMTRKLRADGDLLYTVGAALSVGGGRFGGQETTVRAIHDMMFIQGMILVGDSSSKGIGHQGVCAAQPFSEDNFAHKRLEIMAEAVLEVCKATRDLRK